MKHCTCDICKSEVEEQDVVELKEIYRLEGIKDMCIDCREELNEMHTAMNNAIDNLRISWFKKLIRKIVERKNANRRTNKRSMA